jgi:hypothetical protein
VDKAAATPMLSKVATARHDAETRPLEFMSTLPCLSALSR